MGLRTTLTDLFSAPTARLIDAALRDLVDEILDARDFVRKSELASVERQLREVQRDLAERHADIEAIRQAMTAWAGDLDDEFDDALGIDSDDINRLEEQRGELERKLSRATGALELTREQLETLSSRLQTLEQRTNQAQQVATTARATAETASDGVSTLENC